MTASCQLILLSIDRIWNQAPHSAFTDLIFYHHNYICAFRESDSHFGDKNGSIRIIGSENGIIWESKTSLEFEGYDLRDPKLSLMPDGRLMLLAGASRFNGKQRILHKSLVCFSKDGLTFTPWQKVLDEEWLWKVTWFQGKGYGISYYFEDSKNLKSPTYVRLYSTEDGIHYKLLSELGVTGRPSEGVVRFLPSGEMWMLLRCDGIEDPNAWIGSSFPPYEDWLFSKASSHIGGPDFIILPNKEMIAAGRMVAKSPYGEIEKMALFKMGTGALEPIFILPSGGDSGYPGMLYQAPHLFVSYYSSHEGKASIYLAKFYSAQGSL